MQAQIAKLEGVPTESDSPGEGGAAHPHHPGELARCAARAVRRSAAGHEARPHEEFGPPAPPPGRRGADRRGRRRATRYRHHRRDGPEPPQRREAVRAEELSGRCVLSTSSWGPRRSSWPLYVIGRIGAGATGRVRAAGWSGRLPTAEMVVADAGYAAYSGPSVPPRLRASAPAARAATADRSDPFASADGGMALGDLPVARSCRTVPTMSTADRPQPRGRRAAWRARFGVILVSYDGVETLNGEHAAKRTKTEAKIARRQARRGRQERFSRRSAAWRQWLERRRRPRSPWRSRGRTPSMLCSACPVGGVSAVVDTPRGFWIAKRLE